jgi:hypothetical protein
MSADAPYDDIAVEAHRIWCAGPYGEKYGIPHAVTMAAERCGETLSAGRRRRLVAQVHQIEGDRVQEAIDMAFRGEVQP